MKEFSAQTGGRYTYADDLENLQELALAFAEIFDDCDNFIVSGCEVSGTSISAGYVFLNGKLRKFSGATGITSWPQYIYELNSTESVPYESGGSKVGRNIYSCAIAKSVPATADPLTNKVPVSLAMTASGGLRLKDAFFGKYALLLNPANTSQTVNSQVIFSQAVTANARITANNGVTIQNGNATTTLSYSGSTFSLTTVSSSYHYQFTITDGIGFRFYVHGSLALTIGTSTITFSKPVSASQGTFGGLILTGNHLYQGSANASADLNINMYGYNGGTTQYRNTYIGNGKNTAIISVLGETNAVNITGATTFNSGELYAVTLKAKAVKENTTLTNSISFTDSVNIVMATLGYTSSTDNIFYIRNYRADISILSSSVVNIGPAIQENGTLLTEKYAQITSMNTALALKANAADVYSKTQSDTRFALIGQGLTQFISGSNTAATCRSQIGAVGSDDLNNYAKLTNYLSDMATSDTAKQKIRDNIGAASAGDYEPKQTDTGWILIKDSLYIRQIGKIVCIQGSTKTVHSGTVFTIPNSISAPSHAVKHTIGFANNRTWVCYIAANQRACTVVYCDSSCNKSTEFSITYMI